MQRPRVSVVIPALDAAATIGTQLEALAAQDVDIPWEVLVVDNGSTDRTVEICRGFEDRLPLRVLTCSRPGTSAARNTGARAAHGELLLFCDADDEVAPGWVRAMVAALAEHDAVGGAIEDLRLNGHLAHVPRHPDELPVVAGFLPRTITANLGVRREVWEEVGGFDESYTYGSDDTAFSWSVQLAGFGLGYARDAVVHYRHRGGLLPVALKAYRTAVSRGKLYREFGPRGMPRPRLAGALLRWVRLVVTLPLAAVSAGARRRWADQAGAAVGRVVGSVRYRVRYL